jgi:chemotaxis signal transduction protein
VTTTSRTQPHVVLRLGEGWYGFPAHAVAEVLPCPSLQAVWSQGPDSLGMLRWRGQDVPLVNPVLELGVEATSDPAPWVVIVQGSSPDSAAEPTTIALACHGMDQVRSFPAEEVQSADRAALLCAPACSGIFLSPDGQPIRLVDTGQLTNRLGMRLNQASPPSGTANVHHRGVRNEVAYVVFHARTRIAVPIDQLHEIMPLPVGHACPTPIGPGFTVGSVNWRGKVLPLVDLQRRLWPGQAPRTEARRILITRVDGQLAGLLVGEVDRLIPRQGGTLSQIRLRENQTVNMITVNQEGLQASYSLLEAV